MRTGVASWVPALQLLLDRAGYREEAYFSVSHAPARDDEGVTTGVLTVCSEVTHQIVGERRLALLRDLSVPAGTAPAEVEATCERLCGVLREQPADVPFAAIYLRDGGHLRRVACAGPEVEAVLPESIRMADDEDPWRVREAARTGAPTSIDDVDQRLAVPGGPWGDPVRTAVAYPLPSADRAQPVGVLLAGVTPSRALDDTYRSFLELLAQQVAVAVRNAQAYQEERDRAAALAELDRVKTDFFANVSHEFRTPLTLMLGPLADALNDSAEPLGTAQRARVDTALNNATRLLGLVNDLLTFAGLEAGRAADARTTVDLPELTAELSGVFRAAIERAGLRLVVDCPPLPRPVAIDPVNWEKIVTNLLSNALKFTFVGEIRVRVHADDQAVRLEVADTGIGIAADQLEHLFDRFHRVRGARSRSHEGTGIGLALVRELVRLQGGDVAVRSKPGEGTTFVVTLPWTAVASDGVRTSTAPGTAPGTRLAAARAAAREAGAWLDEGSTSGPALPDDGHADDDLAGARILVADDNSDMRAYLSRLLVTQRWQVETATDGQAALDVVRRRLPDLLLTDVMMPRLDGFALVRAIRQDEATSALPVVMLSARAGQESGVEGMQAGADDYVVKPFTAAELIARIRSTLRLARVRAAHTRQMTALAGTAAVIASGRALEDAFEAVTEQARLLVGGIAAETVLDGDGSRAALQFLSAGPELTEDEAWLAFRTDDDSDLVRAVIRSRDNGPIGSVSVRIDPKNPPPEPAPALLAAMADMLASLAQNDWQLEHERQMALTMQQGLLPESLPVVDGWELQAAYRPAVGHVGGDWYDVISLPDGDLMISIGDVAGHGLGAAVTTGQVRNAVRAYAVENRTPADVVALVAALLGRLHTPPMATLFLLRLSPATGELAWCSAGHPPPVRSVPGEPTTLLTGPVGPPLGLIHASYKQIEETLPPGGQLLLYTDGLVEDFPASIDVGLARLQQRCHQVYAAGAPATATLDAVLADVPEPRDDIAAVVVRSRRPAVRPGATGTPDLNLTWTYPLESGASAEMRRDLRKALSGTTIDPDLLHDLQVAATEAVNNAVEHAQRPSRPEVEVQLRAADGVLRVVVQDFGGWRSRPPARDRGRGAVLMNAYGDVRVTPTATGTMVTIERRWE
jgi:signal transduction histidine kinase/FixJ family two-component response regulator